MFDLRAKGQSAAQHLHQSWQKPKEEVHRYWQEHGVVPAPNLEFFLQSFKHGTNAEKGGRGAIGHSKLKLSYVHCLLSSDRQTDGEKVQIRQWKQPCTTVSQGTSIGVKQILSNVTNAATGFVPNEVAHGVCVNANINLLRDRIPQEYEKLRLLKQKAAGEAIAFANAMTKARYDSKYTPLNPKNKDKKYLRLHHGYKVPGQENRKLHRQRVGSFHTLGKLGNRAYKLDLHTS